MGDLDKKLVDYLVWTIFNVISHQPEPEEQSLAWGQLTGQQQVFANQVWKRVEELEEREMDEGEKDA